MKYLFRRLSMATVVATLALTGGAATAHAGNQGPFGVTCLNRTSDGFNGCWKDGTPASTVVSEAMSYYECSNVVVTFDGNTPASRHGVPRTNAIALKSMGINSGWSGLSSWFGAGHAAFVPGIYSNDAGNVYAYLGMPNSYAHLWITAYGPGNCQLW